MEFPAVELPAEALPLNEKTLLNILGNASGSSASRDIQSATKQLQAWEHREGYFELLQKVYLQRELPVEVRLLALIQLKNGVDKYWRKSSSNSIVESEVDRIRSNLLPNAPEEENSRLAKLQAVLIAKVARIDYPIRWPDLVPQLIELTKYSLDGIHIERSLINALEITAQVVKELSTVRLQRARASYLASTPGWLKFLGRLYEDRVVLWQQHVFASPGGPLSATEINFLASERILAIFRHLVSSGFDFPHDAEEVRKLWGKSGQHLSQFIELSQQPEFSVYHNSIDKHLDQLARFHVSVAQKHPISFVLLPSTIDLVKFYWNGAKATRQRKIQRTKTQAEFVTPTGVETYELSALLMLRSCFKLAHDPATPFKFKVEKYKDDPARARQDLKSGLLHKDFVADLFQHLIEIFFQLLPEDLEEWISEPEEWEMKEQGEEDAYERSARACAERLFLDVAMHHREQIVGSLVEIVNTCSGTGYSNPFMKDAVWAAAGVAAPMLSGSLDFNSLLENQIQDHFRGETALPDILRRRIAILLAKWVPVGISHDRRPIVYEIYQFLLDPAKSELPVRIVAGKRFQDIVGEFEFQPEPFRPYASTALTRLIELIREVDLPQTKLDILNSVAAVVERMQREVAPFAEQIVSMLPPLWDESGQEHLMQQSIMRVLSNLVSSLQTESAPLQPLVVPLIKDAVKPGSSSYVYLLNDALDLWCALLEQTPEQVSPALQSLAPAVLPLLEMETEIIEKVIQIIKSYAVVTPATLLQDDIRPALFRAFISVFTVRKPYLIGAMCEVLEVLIRASQDLGASQGVHTTVSDLSSGAVLPHMLSTIYCCWESHQTTGPNRKDLPTDWRSEGAYFSVLSRILLADVAAFNAMLSYWAASAGVAEAPEGSAKARLLEEWFAFMDAASDPSQNKLLALALTHLLGAEPALMLGHLQSLMALWTSAIFVVYDVDGEPLNDSLVYQKPDMNGEQEEPALSRNSTALLYADPVHKVNLAMFIREKLRSAVELCGGEQKFEADWLVNVDKDVVRDFGRLGII